MNQKSSLLRTKKILLVVYTTDSLIKCLSEYINLTEKTLQALRNEEVNGSALLQSSQEELKEWEVPGGPAKNIIGLINKIKGEEQELKKKRKAEEEFVITALKKRKWMVNSAITREERPIVYFVDLTKQNAPLFELINQGEFIALHGSRASGKSTRVLQL
ncbi:polyketide biosynthesis operon protein cyro [Gigaspora margarita]|uniref:Polyketide biosynthesis operon protein cyro n=1 Tax=Gigaspora margarita TaxID=4874 RepID=A0A8H3X978_GIGMA|nr:polyketide biosynthesis operon protein cyro [Gigaspora margarita]